MRFLESTIKAAILHPEEEVRVTAVTYFCGSFSPDESIMPLVILAVETHGRGKAFRILLEPQSAKTVCPQTKASQNARTHGNGRFAESAPRASSRR
jgi:hypothetical protein